MRLTLESMATFFIGILNVYVFILFVRAVLSWFPSDTGVMRSVRAVLLAVTEPVLMPVRRVLRPIHIGGATIDLSMFAVTVFLHVVVRQLVTATL